MTATLGPMSLRASIDADVRAYLRYALDAEAAAAAKPLRRLSALCTPAVSCCALHRLAHACAVRGWSRLARGVALWNHVLHKAAINPRSEIGPGMYLPHPFGTVFNGRAGPGLVLYAGAIVGTASARGAWDGQIDDAPVLGSNVVVAATAIVTGRWRVGDGAVIGVSVVLDRDVPAHAAVLTQARHSRRTAA